MFPMASGADRPGLGVVAGVVALLLAASGCSAVSDSELADDPAAASTTTAASGTAGDGDGTGNDPTTGEVTTTEPPEPPNLLPGTWTSLNEPGVGGRITSLSFDPFDPDRLLVGGDMLGIALTDDFGTTWQPTSGLASWEIGDITSTPAADGRIWTGSLSGPQASADGGRTWTLERQGMPPISDARYSLPIESILVDPGDGARLLAFSGNQRNWSAPGAYSDGNWQGDGSVWQSTDAGESWSRLSIVAAGGNIRAATFLGGEADQLLAAVANRGVWASSDGGRTWREASSGLPHLNAYDIASHPADPGIAWVAMGEGPNVNGTHIAGGIWSTSDGGRTWSAANSGLQIVANATAVDTASFHQIVVAPSDPARLYTSNVAPGQASIYRSDDGGATWTIIADASTPRPNPYEGALRAFDIAVHPADPDRVAIGSDDTLMGSDDGGRTWTDLTTAAVGSERFVGRGYSGLVSTDIVFDPRRPDDLILLGFDGGNFIQTVDDGASWRRTIQDISQWGGAVEAVYSASDPSRIYVLLGQFSDFRGIGLSTDGGASFELLVGPERGLPARGNVPGGAAGLAVLDNNGTDIVFAVVGRQLWRSIDGGAGFGPVGGIEGARDVAVSGEGIVFVATDDEVLASADSGESFEPLPGSPTGVSGLFTSAAEPLAVYAVAFRAENGGVFRWDDTSWSQILTDRFAHSVAIDPTDPSKIAVVTTEPAFHDVSNATGVHLSTDSGQTWAIMNEGLPMTRLRTVEFDPHEPDRLLVGTTGRGFFEISFAKATAR